jgi:DNA-binding XRE family transcriptional regulator
MNELDGSTPDIAADAPPDAHATGGRAGSVDRGAGGRRAAARWNIVINGQRLREVRRDRGLSRNGVADMANISVTTVARLERSQRVSCKKWTLHSIAAVLGEDPVTFLTGR